MLPTHLQRFALVLSFFCCSAANAQDGKQGDGALEQGELLFGAMCAACHVHDRMHVGPSLVEIAGLYGDKRKDFLAWCKDPQPKRKGVIQMPSMAALTDAHLMSIHGYIVASTKGMKEVVVKDADKFRASPSMRKRPLVMRLFMPDAGPAAIAVAVNNDYHFCFDAGACRLRYVWKGDFVDGWPVWKSNGNGLAKVVGEVLLREAKSPLPVAENAKRKFLGYRLKDGLPTFRYRVGEVEVQERITMSSDGQALARHFVLRGAPADWRMMFVASDKLDYFSEHGLFEGAMFTPNKGKEAAFTVIMEEKN